METLGQRLRRLRKNKGWTLAQASTMLGLKGHSTYSNWEYDRTQPDAEMLAKIAEVHGVTTDYLLTGSNELVSQYIKLHEQKNKSQEIINNLIAKKKSDESHLPFSSSESFIKIPIYGEIRAGYDMIAQQNIIGYEIVAREQVSDGEYFFLVVKGDSMAPKLVEGMRVLVRRQDFVDNGAIGVVLVNGDEGTLKRVYYNNNGTVTLTADNTAYPPRILPIEEVRIQGQAIKYQGDL